MPDFSQNFNRYSYCLNNPLRFTDPSGELFVFLAGVSKGSIDLVIGTCKFIFAGGNFNREIVQGYTKPIRNGLKIDAGLFVGDPVQIISR